MTDKQLLVKINDILKDAQWSRNGGQTFRAEDDVDKARILLKSHLN